MAFLPNRKQWKIAEDIFTGAHRVEPLEPFDYLVDINQQLPCNFGILSLKTALPAVKKKSYMQ